MKNKIIATFLMLLAVTAVAKDANGPSVIPQPQKMELQAGTFQLTAQTRVLVDSTSKETAKILTERIRTATGYRLKISTSSDATVVPGGILLTAKNAQMNLGPEGYELTVAPDGIVIRASTQA